MLLDKFTKDVAELFISQVVEERGGQILEKTLDKFKNTAPLEPIIINSCSSLTISEKAKIIGSYNEYGASYIIPLDKPKKK